MTCSCVSVQHSRLPCFDIHQLNAMLTCCRSVSLQRLRAASRDLSSTQTHPRRPTKTVLKPIDPVPPRQHSNPLHPRTDGRALTYPPGGRRSRLSCGPVFSVSSRAASAPVSCVCVCDVMHVQHSGPVSGSGFLLSEKTARGRPVLPIQTRRSPRPETLHTSTEEGAATCKDANISWGI